MGYVVIIGGGASGMMAAVAAASAGAKVTIVEHKDRVGKKLLSTGNGKCNFTNASQSADCYHSDNKGFAWKIVCRFDEKAVCDFFRELGVYPKERNGCYYPHSAQASSVLDVLRMELERLHVTILTGQECRGILSRKGKFHIELNDRELICDKVILAAGSKAAAVTGSDGSGYILAKKLGHHLIPVLPALVQLKCAESFYKSISGVRINAKVSLFTEETLLASDQGEVQLTAYGISGIPTFQVSRYAAKALYAGKKVTARLDFAPEMSFDELLSFFIQRAQTRPQKKAEEFLTGMFPKKLNDLWIRLCDIERSKEAGSLTKRELVKLTAMIKEFSTHVTSTNSFEQAQVCCGGIDTSEVNPLTLESRLVPGMYFAGEILDVDGPCGGYNLQWAWSSGHVAGREAANASYQSIKTRTGAQ